MYSFAELVPWSDDEVDDEDDEEDVDDKTIISGLCPIGTNEENQDLTDIGFYCRKNGGLNS